MLNKKTVAHAAVFLWFDFFILRAFFREYENIIDKESLRHTSDSDFIRVYCGMRSKSE
jgi:hypothetical protein